MSELGPDARALLDVALDGDEPSFEDAARVREAAARLTRGGRGDGATVAVKAGALRRRRPAERDGHGGDRAAGGRAARLPGRARPEARQRLQARRVWAALPAWVRPRARVWPRSSSPRSRSSGA